MISLNSIVLFHIHFNSQSSRQFRNKTLPIKSHEMCGSFYLFQTSVYCNILLPWENNACNKYKQSIHVEK